MILSYKIKQDRGSKVKNTQNSSFKEKVKGDTYILLDGQFGPLASAVRTEYCKVPRLTWLFARKVVQNALHDIQKTRIECYAFW
jgi:hypothetical protein